ncbi:MAG: alpha/beta hydrolase [Burkholderiales bacterium]|nr:alpha/beta hydrolase [Burkholderiales bacterium]
MQYVNANGVTLCYHVDGSPTDTPLLLIMGLGMQLTAWPLPLVEMLVQQGFYVIRLDNRDCGLSSKMGHLGKPNIPLAIIKTMLRMRLKSGYHLRDMALDAIAVLDAVGVAKAHVVGASMGGMIAQILAAEFPQRVASLTSIMSTSGRRGLPGPTRAARKVIMQRPSAPYQQEQIIAQFLRIFEVIGSPAYPTPESHLRQRIALSMARSFYPEVTTRQMLAIAASGSRSRLLKKITAPSLIIHGDADPLVPLACGEDTANCIVGSQLRVIPGMAHDLPLQLLPKIGKMIVNHCRGEAIPH